MAVVLGKEKIPVPMFPLRKWAIVSRLLDRKAVTLADKK